MKFQISRFSVPVLFAIVGTVAIFAGLEAQAQVAGSVNIQCDSNGYAPAQCAIGFSNAKVTLAQGQSTGRGRCVEGVNWRTDGSTIFVNDGCRGIFHAEARVFNVSCASQGYAPAACPIAGPVLDVRLVQPQSTGRGQCRQGVNWRFDNNNIYVSDGCRGIFEVTRDLGDRPQHPGRAEPGYPQPRPQPGYPQPGPGRGGRGGYDPRAMTCDRDRTDIYQSTFIQVKQFAYMVDGLNMFPSDATNFATEWTRKYPCSSADTYIREARSIRDAATAFDGFGMNMREAGNYVVQAMDKRCYSGVDYLGEARQHYNFASSPQGLGMNFFRAREYAREQLERKFLSCPGRMQ